MGVRTKRGGRRGGGSPLRRAWGVWKRVLALPADAAPPVSPHTGAPPPRPAPPHPDRPRPQVWDFSRSADARDTEGGASKRSLLEQVKKMRAYLDATE